MRIRAVAIVVLIAGALTTAQAQWFNHPAPGIPRTKDGKPDLSARAPRAADGKPDLSGVWITDATPLGEMERLFPDLKTFAVPGDDPRLFNKFFINILSDVQRQDDPIRPQFAELLKKQLENFGKDNPTSKCLPAGIPMGEFLPIPRRFIQVPGLLVVLYEGINPQRMIYLDGRKHPVDPQPAWMGYSVGKWEGDTLVIDTVGFNDLTWLDAMGHPHSEAMRITERLRRRDLGHIETQMTIDDSRAYTKPFSVKYTQTLTPDADVIESVCAENERDRARLVGK